MTTEKSSLKKIVFRYLMDRYKKYKQKRVDLNSANAQKSIRELLSAARYVFLMTNSDSSRCCNARYVQPIIEWEGNHFKVWIGTYTKSRKIAELSDNSNVTLALGNDSAGANLIIHGTATLHTDEAVRVKYWKPEWRMFFPAGPTDSNAIAVCVTPTALELMDFKRNIIPEPFGLRVMQLVWQDKQWNPVTSA